MERKINIFIVHTEYHFIQSLNIAMSLFNEGVYENHIHITKNGDRFENVIDTDLDNNIFIKFHIDKKPSQLVNEILELSNCYRLFFFQENSIYNRYLAYELKKKHNTIVSLGPDGYKPYAIFNKKHEFLSVVKDTFNDHKELFKNGLKTSKILVSEYYRYGSSSYIDEIWLTDVNCFDVKKNKAKAKLKAIPPFSIERVLDIKLYFKVLPNPLEGKENIILYLNQPFWTEDLIRKEMVFLNDLTKHFDRMIYLKLHPGTAEHTIERYKGIRNLEIIDSKLPSELLMFSVKNSIIYSGWSSALITNNSSCNYYFNLPIYKNCGAKTVDQSDLIILDHINVIDTPELMKFPHE